MLSIPITVSPGASLFRTPLFGTQAYDTKSRPRLKAVIGNVANQLLPALYGNLYSLAKLWRSFALGVSDLCSLLELKSDFTSTVHLATDRFGCISYGFCPCGHSSFDLAITIAHSKDISTKLGVYLICLGVSYSNRNFHLGQLLTTRICYYDHMLDGVGAA